MNAQVSPLLPLLRLLQVTDSAFPVGSYAYSHGLEWLVHTGRANCEEVISDVLTGFVVQPLRRQLFPAAARAFRAPHLAAVIRADDALDASIVSSAEREAGRAMGERLLRAAADSVGGGVAAEYAERVRAGGAPGQYAVAFALLARDASCDEGQALAALGHASVASLVSAALRLGVIGQSAGIRLQAKAAPGIADAVNHAISQPRPVIGSFAPFLEAATILQPTLQFRMFAS